MFSNPGNPLHMRNGGLIGLAGTAIALGVDIAPYMEKFVDPLLVCFTDPENRVRYFSAECLYNIAKVSKGEILVYFNSIFDALSKVSYCIVLALAQMQAHISLLQIRSFLSRTARNCWIGCSRISSLRLRRCTYLNILRRKPFDGNSTRLTAVSSSLIQTTLRMVQTSVAHEKPFRSHISSLSFRIGSTS